MVIEYLQSCAYMMSTSDHIYIAHIQQSERIERLCIDENKNVGSRCRVE
jgi:hypothetical protein